MKLKLVLLFVGQEKVWPGLLTFPLPKPGPLPLKPQYADQRKHNKQQLKKITPISKHPSILTKDQVSYYMGGKSNPHHTLSCMPEFFVQLGCSTD